MPGATVDPVGPNRHSAFENAFRTARTVGIVLKWLHKLRVESIQIFYRAPKTSTVFRYNQ